MLLADIGQRLTETFGLNPALLASAALESAVRQRQAARGLGSLAAYGQELRNSPAEWQHLVETLVVPETWFLRDPAAFAALTAFARERLPRCRGRALRLLSLPCSTGEEPYSMAMALLDAGTPPAAFQIDAVDINRHALEHAQRALYGGNSFRGTDAAFRGRYFTAVAGRYRLADHVRQRVTFHAGNLCADDVLSNVDAYDVVFCRNLLIYFHVSALDKAARALRRLLAPDGFLVVAASEVQAAVDRGLAPYRGSEPAVTSRRRVSRRAAGSLRSMPDAASCPPRAVRQQEHRARTTAAPRPAETSPAPLAGSLEVASQLADQGSFIEAAARCEAHLREYGPSPAACYLLGLVRDAQDDPIGAAKYYRQTLYLDPNHHEALSHYALVLERLGDPSRAQVARARARRLQTSGAV